MWDAFDEKDAVGIVNCFLQFDICSLREIVTELQMSG
jgi:hypothetical protein